MKPKEFLLTVLPLVVFAVGCHREPTAAEQLDRVQVRTEAAAEDMKDYTYAQKAVFVEKMQVELTGLNHDLDQLAAKIEKSTNIEAKHKLQALREQSAKLNQQLDEVKNATESTWNSVKASSRKAFNDAKNGFQSARQWVSDKIAP